MGSLDSAEERVRPVSSEADPAIFKPGGLGQVTESLSESQLLHLLNGKDTPTRHNSK